MPPASRALCLILLAPLGGCVGLGVAAGVDAAALSIMGKDLVDAGVSAVSGRDCSVARLDRRQSYCKPADPASPSAYCTRTLGTVECWAEPDGLPNRPRSVTDTPTPQRPPPSGPAWLQAVLPL